MSVKRSWCGFERSQNVHGGVLSGATPEINQPDTGVAPLKTPPWTFHANVTLKSTSSDGFNPDLSVNIP